MSGQIPRPMASIVLVATLLVWGMGLGVPTNTARADACLTAPNSPVPDGSRWYYHMDRANQRKCWYIRASDQPEQHAAAQASSDSTATTPTAALRKPATDSPSAPMSISPGDGAAPPLPPVKPQRASKRNATTDELQKSAQKGSTAPLIKPATDSAGASMPTSSGDSTAPPVPSLKPQRAPLRGTITDQPVQQGAQKGSPASSIAEAPAAQPSQSSQTSDQGAAPAPVARPVWPDPPASTVKTEQPAAPPSEARPESNQPTVDARASDGAESTAQGNASFANAGMMASLTSTPISIFPVAALGLVVAGFLLRVVIRNSVGRRRRIAVDRQDFDWSDDRPQHELPDDQFVQQRDGLTDYLRRSSIPVATDFGAGRPSRVKNERPDNPRRRGHAPRLTDKISKREHQRLGVDPREADGIGDRHRQEWRDDQKQDRSLGAGDELLDDLQSALVAASDHRPRPPLQADDGWSNDGRGKDAACSDEITEREMVLERLRRDLDRMLQSPKLA